MVNYRRITNQFNNLTSGNNLASVPQEMKQDYLNKKKNEILNEISSTGNNLFLNTKIIPLHRVLPPESLRESMLPKTALEKQIQATSKELFQVL